MLVQKLVKSDNEPKWSVIARSDLKSIAEQMPFKMPRPISLHGYEQSDLGRKHYACLDLKFGALGTIEGGCALQKGK